MWIFSTKKRIRPTNWALGELSRSPNLFKNDMTVFQNVLVAALSHQKELEAASVKANEVIAMCGLENIETVLPVS